MSISCDKCKQEGTEENPVFYTESYLKGVPILEAVRDLKILNNPQMNPWEPITTPCTLHLHADCAKRLFNLIEHTIKDFIEPKEKPGGKKKAKDKTKDA